MSRDMRFPIAGYELRPSAEDDMCFVMQCVRDSLLLSVPDIESLHSDLWIGDILGVTSIAMEGRMMRSEGFVLKDSGGRSAGILWMGVSRDQFTCEDTGYLLGLFVIGELRGKGLGKALMGCAEEWCRDKGLFSMTLNVGSSNGHAKTFYGKLGFEDRSAVMRRRFR